MDYIIKNPLNSYLFYHNRKNSAEDITLSQILKLDEKLVRAALEKLVKDGILNKVTRSKAEFENSISKKMEIDLTNIQFRTIVTKVQIYSFKIDLIFILKAKIFLLRQNFNE